jgi:hypothetical protein
MIFKSMGGEKTPQAEQKKVHTGEVFGLWQHLTQRYDIRELTDIFKNFAKDAEFRALGKIPAPITINLHVYRTAFVEKTIGKYKRPML